VTTITGTLYEDQYKFFIKSLSFLLGMRIISGKFEVKIKTHISCLVAFFLKNPAVYEIMWKIL
jgi:hypothetical protein